MTRLDVLAFAWEAGSAAAIAPVVRVLLERGHRVSSFALEPARQILAARCAGATVLAAPPPRGVDAIVMGLGGPSRRDGVDAWRAVRPLGPSLCVLDHWKGMDRFLDAGGRVDASSLPDRVAVIDEASREALLRRGLAPDAVLVTGQPQLASLLSHDPRAGGNGAAIRARVGLDAGVPVHVLASERLHDAPLHRPAGGSVSIAQARCGALALWQALLDDARAQGREAVLLMRPHPVEGADNPTALRMVDGALASDLDLLAIADRVYGVSSMLLVQAACLGIEAVNVAPRLDGFAPAQAYLDDALWRSVSAAGWFGAFGPHTPRPVPDTGAAQRAADAVERLARECAA